MRCQRTLEGQRSTLVGDGLLFPGGLAIQKGPNGPVFYVSTMTVGPVGGAVVRISAVPEPGTWALLLAGLGALGVVARRRVADGARATRQ